MTRATVVGAGGLGGPLALGLAAAGVEVAIVDPDQVELSNLHRQIHFTSLDVGKPKASVLAGAVVARGGVAAALAIGLAKGDRTHAGSIFVFDDLRKKQEPRIVRFEPRAGCPACATQQRMGA